MYAGCTPDIFGSDLSGVLKPLRIVLDGAIRKVMYWTIFCYSDAEQSSLH